MSTTNGYFLTITNKHANSKTDGKIELTTRDPKDVAPIVSAEFKMNTINDNTLNHSDSVRAELVISGNISKEYKQVTSKFAQWALDNDQNTLYRDVQLLVYEDKGCSGELLRRYQIDDMFVIDYTESFGAASDEASGNSAGTYELFLAQKVGNARKVVSTQ